MHCSAPACRCTRYLRAGASASGRNFFYEAILYSMHAHAMAPGVELEASHPGWWRTVTALERACGQAAIEATYHGLVFDHTELP